MSTEVINKTVRIKSGTYNGVEYWVEDTLQNLLRVNSPTEKISNPACMMYVVRMVKDKLPKTGQVYGGKIGGLSYLIHESEIGEVICDGRKRI